MILGMGSNGVADPAPPPSFIALPKIFPLATEGIEIPEILTSGDHGRVAAWRREMAEKLTKSRRPDLWERYQNRKNRR